MIPFAGCFQDPAEAAEKSPLVFAGLPSDSQSSYLRGCAAAPDRIRKAYDGRCYNATTETGVDLTGQVSDLGNLPPSPTWSHTAERYHEFGRSVFAAGQIPFLAGGDHAVTIPIVEALDALGVSVHVVQIDAHPDLYQEYDGRRTSHACTGARVLEMGHVASLTQVGIRTHNEAQTHTAEMQGTRLRIISAHAFASTGLDLSHISAESLVYLTLDLDALDPAFAPGVSHPVPGGLSSREVLRIIQQIPGRLIGMDAVEVNPQADFNDQTAILAARCLHEAMGLALRQWQIE